MYENNYSTKWSQRVVSLECIRRRQRIERSAKLRWSPKGPGGLAAPAAVQRVQRAGRRERARGAAAAPAGGGAGGLGRPRGRERRHRSVPSSQRKTNAYISANARDSNKRYYKMKFSIKSCIVYDLKFKL